MEAGRVAHRIVVTICGHRCRARRLRLQQSRLGRATAARVPATTSTGFCRHTRRRWWGCRAGMTRCVQYGRCSTRVSCGCADSMARAAHSKSTRRFRGENDGNRCAPTVSSHSKTTREMRSRQTTQLFDHHTSAAGAVGATQQCDRITAGACENLRKSHADRN